MYCTPIDKMALAAAATKVAKQETVALEGIGEDIPFSLMAWREGVLTAICQLDPDFGDETPEERLMRTVEAAAVCRRGFDVTAFTFVTEGYCATDPTVVDARVSLAAQFVENHDVQECLTVTHIEAGNVYLAAWPYRYELGRRVVWGDPLRYEPTRPGTNQFLSSMVEILLKDMVEAPFIDDREAWNDLVAQDVARWGFHVRYGMELDD